jgi:transcriptional regulator with XRE-family HTH domain
VLCDFIGHEQEANLVVPSDHWIYEDSQPLRAVPAARFPSAVPRCGLNKRLLLDGQGAKLPLMMIGDRLKELRMGKNMSQGGIQARTGLLRCYISRVENGHTVPAVQTLEKMARALEVPMYKLFLKGKPEVLKLPKMDGHDFGSGKNADEFRQFRRTLGKIKRDGDLKLLLFMAQKMQKPERTGIKVKR